MRKISIAAWGFLFDHQVSPLRHIKDFQVQNMTLHLLGWMWGIAFSLAIGSYTFLAFSLLGHAVLIGALGITMGTYVTASYRPELIVKASARIRRP